MRIAIVSDIHGNLTAFEAVLADLRETSPDLILHGGDLADSGSSPVEIVDRFRDLGWQGVVGNTDEMLFAPETLEAFASQSPRLELLWNAVRDMAEAAREALGEDWLSWLHALRRMQIQGPLALLHGIPESVWHAPMREATDAELELSYEVVKQPVIIYGHIHKPFIRRIEDSKIPGRLVLNCGSVGLSHDGDPRAAYLILDDCSPTVRRVEYDMDRELRALASCGMPHADWISKIIQSAAPQMP